MPSSIHIFNLSFSLLPRRRLLARQLSPGAKKMIRTILSHLRVRKQASSSSHLDLPTASDILRQRTPPRRDVQILSCISSSVLQNVPPTRTLDSRSLSLDSFLILPLSKLHSQILAQFRQNSIKSSPVSSHMRCT